MTELLPCPFCGGEAKAYVKDYGDTHYWRVSCSSDRCGVNPVTNVYHTEAEAIAAWNTRVERVTVYLNGEQGITVCGKTYVPERTCRIEYPYYGDAPVVNGQPRCSECKTEFAVCTFPNYCPNCGARVTKSDQYL